MCISETEKEPLIIDTFSKVNAVRKGVREGYLSLYFLKGELRLIFNLYLPLSSLILIHSSGVRG